MVPNVGCSDVIETETWLKLWDRDLRHEKFVDYADSFLNIFKKMSSLLRSWIFFEFLAFFLLALVVSYLQAHQTKNTWKCIFADPCRCSIQSVKAILLWPRPVAFETETCKNESCWWGVPLPLAGGAYPLLVGRTPCRWGRTPCWWGVPLAGGGVPLAGGQFDFDGRNWGQLTRFVSKIANQLFYFILFNGCNVLWKLV